MSSADKTKLDGIESNATADQTDAEIKTAYENNSDTNAFTDAEKTKLSGVEASATADQTASEIRTLVESATDSNVFTDADHTKLNAIESGATADQTNAEIRAAVEAATDSNVFTDADHAKLNAIEASATADQTAAEIRTLVESATDSNVFTDADHTKLNNIDVTNDRISVDSNGKFIITGDTGQYPTIRIEHSANTVEGEVIRFERTDANNARFHSLKARSHSGDTDENYLSFHIHDRNGINTQVEQLKITPNSILLNYDGTTKAQTVCDGLDLPNDSKVQLGTSQDLRVYHTGSLGVIRNDTGTLYIDSNDFEFRSSSGSSAFQKFIKLDADANGDGGVVQLYFDNVLKAQTSSDGFDLPDNSKLQFRRFSRFVHIS